MISPLLPLGGFLRNFLQYLQRGRFYSLPQCLVKAVARYHVCRVSENLDCGFSHVHQFKEAEFTSPIVEEQINVGFVARGGAEQIEMLDAEPLEVGRTLLETPYGFVAFHRIIVARLDRCVRNYSALN